MPDIFVSYSRRDKEFVEVLATALRESGRDVWVDIEGIEDAEEFPAAIRSAIEGSDTFAFVITPDSAASQYCGQEVDYARDLRKRIVPILRAPVSDDVLPPEIRDRNWIPFVDDSTFEESLQRLLSACDRDLDHAKQHTRWLLKALEWDTEDRDRSFLLRGSELRSAEEWITRAAPGADPEPTALQREYVLQSRRATSRRGRLTVVGAIVITVLALVLGAVSLVSRSQAVSAKATAVDERITAQVRAMAEAADANLDTDPQVSLVLGQRALRTRDLPQSAFALRAALDRSPLLRQYGAPHACGVGYAATMSDAVFDPTGPRIATVTCDGTAVLRDSTTLKVLVSRTKAVHMPDGWIRYSSDGKLIAVGAQDGVVVLDARTLAEVRRLTLKGRDYPTFSADGSWLLVGNLPRIDVALASLWRMPLDGRTPTALVRDNLALHWDFVDGGAEIALTTTDHETVEIRDATTGKLVRRLETGGDSGTAYFVGVVGSPDGSMLAVGVATPAGTAQIQIWSTRTWKRIRTLDPPRDGTPYELRFSPDSKLLATVESDGLTDIWLIATGGTVGTVGDTSTETDYLSFDSTGSQLAATARDGTVRIWRPHGPERFDAPVGFNPVAQIGDLADGGSVITAVGPTGGTNGEVERWRASDGHLLARTSLPPGTLHAPYTDGSYNDGPSLSQDGSLVLVVVQHEGNPELQILSTDTMTPVATLPYVTYGTAKFSPHDDQLALFAASQPDGSPLMAPATLVDIPSGKTVRLASTQADWATVAYSADGSFLVGRNATADHILTWRATDGALLRNVKTTLLPGDVESDPADSAIGLVTETSDVSIIDVGTGRVLHTLAGAQALQAAFSSDGRYVISESYSRRSVDVWSADTGTLLRTQTFTAAPSALAVDPRGSDFVVHDISGVIRVFDTCDACENPAGLLRLAAARGSFSLTAREDAVLSADS